MISSYLKNNVFGMFLCPRRVVLEGWGEAAIPPLPKILANSFRSSRRRGRKKVKIWKNMCNWENVTTSIFKSFPPFHEYALCWQIWRGVREETIFLVVGPVTNLGEEEPSACHQYYFMVPFYLWTRTEESHFLWSAICGSNL